MSKYLMDFEQFQFMLAKPEGLVFVDEREDRYVMETCVGYACIRCEKMKGESEENIMFVERFLANNQNVRRVQIIEYTPTIRINVENDMGQ